MYVLLKHYSFGLLETNIKVSRKQENPWHGVTCIVELPHLNTHRLRQKKSSAIYITKSFQYWYSFIDNLRAFFTFFSFSKFFFTFNDDDIRWWNFWKPHYIQRACLMSTQSCVNNYKTRSTTDYIKKMIINKKEKTSKQFTICVNHIRFYWLAAWHC